jgi:hypothetical protein
MNGKVLNSLGAGIDDVAASIAKSDWYKSVIPKNMNSELASYVAGSPKITSAMAQDSVRDTLKSRMDITPEIEEAIQKISAENIDETVDAALKDIGNIPDAVADIMKQRANDSVTNIDGSKIVRKMTKTERYMNMPKAYFSHPDKKVRDTRIATAAAAYAGVAIGGRYLSGGTLTSDNYGRKDIAGVPFL